MVIAGVVVMEAMVLVKGTVVVVVAVLVEGTVVVVVILVKGAVVVVVVKTEEMFVEEAILAKRFFKKVMSSSLEIFCAKKMTQIMEMMLQIFMVMGW